MVAYANLKAEMARKGISNIQMAAVIKTTEKTFRNKQRGITPFTWIEAHTIHTTFFPDIDYDYLFNFFQDTA